MKSDTLILGAGITGLSAGVAAGAEVFEAASIPGGICASYYVRPDGQKTFHRSDEGSYRFEIGGGHWIFGAGTEVLKFINALTPVREYERLSSVYFPDMDLYAPYPIQNHLSYLPSGIREKALAEIMDGGNTPAGTLADWLEANFGKTLCELFFFPFHELYTAGLYTIIAPQDAFKTPINKDLIVKGSRDKTPAVGYNSRFVYPVSGLDELIRKMSGRCKVNYGKKAVRIDPGKREVEFAEGEAVRYENIVSTLPLNEALEMAGLDCGKKDPFTSVLVINIGARTGVKCPPDQWIYVPKSRAGFHRVGFYSNVDVSFLPGSSRSDKSRVSIYIEKAYGSGRKPDEAEIKRVCDESVRELKEWQFISDAEVVDPTWIEIAYTWQYPGSAWREDAVELLRRHGIYQTGRYGKWKFQGIAESIRDGLRAGSILGTS